MIIFIVVAFPTYSSLSNSIISEVQVVINLPGHAKQYHYAFTIRSSTCCLRLAISLSAAFSISFSLSSVLLI